MVKEGFQALGCGVRKGGQTLERVCRHSSSLALTGKWPVDGFGQC